MMFVYIAVGAVGVLTVCLGGMYILAHATDIWVTCPYCEEQQTMSKEEARKDAWTWTPRQMTETGTWFCSRCKENIIGCLWLHPYVKPILAKRFARQLTAGKTNELAKAYIESLTEESQ